MDANLNTSLQAHERRFFRDQFREARAAALLDSEGFYPIVTTLERLGALINPRGQGLGQFKSQLLEIASQASAAPSTEDNPALFTALDTLYSAVQEGRNDAVHQGAYARHLVRHSLELALLVEEGLMVGLRTVGDFMVRDVVAAEPWQPVSLARQRILLGSFSYLPIRFNEKWYLLSDHSVARYLAVAPNRRQALRRRISDAVENSSLPLTPVTLVTPDIVITTALATSGGIPVLVVDKETLLGIATSFDFL